VTDPSSLSASSSDSLVPDEGGAVFTRYRRTQVLVLIASVLCFLLFWWAGGAMSIPAEFGLQDSILQQASWPLDILAIYVLLAVSAVLGSIIAGRSWFFGGLFAALAGLMALSIRGGPMRDVLFHAYAAGPGRGIFTALAFEQCLLFLPIGFGWFAVWRRYEQLLPLPAKTDKPIEEGGVALAVAAQVAAMGVIVWFLAATDAKKQVLVGVFLGGLAGTALGDYLMPHPKAVRWYWVGPFAVGFVGYLLAWSNAAPWTTGSPLGMLAPLARALPLDYASAGSAGALLGYWLAAERPHASFWMRSRKTVDAPPKEPV
jgi:hypothetical protein